MESPKHLSHKPIISVNNYDEIDASSANDTDAKALSIGRAQYDNNELSLKVWRHTEEKWSRQSEELPIHRNLDLSILFLAAISTEISAHFPKSNLREVIDNYSEVQFIKDYYEANRIYIEPRLIELKRILNNMNI